jgi:hypothetical protein
MNILIPRVIKNWGKNLNINFDRNFVNNPVSFGRRFAKQKNNQKLWKKSFSEFNLFPQLKEPVLGDLVMNHYENKACTHIHKDSAPEGYVHIRANLMLEKPTAGGDIIIDDEVIQVDKHDLWLVLASLENHGSTPIKNGQRLIYSFGAIIEQDKIKHLTER